MGGIKANRTTRAVVTVATVVAVAVGWAWADGDGRAQRHVVRSAHFTALPAAGDAFASVAGTAKLVIDRPRTRTTVRVDLRGLAPSAEYPAYVHVGDCGPDVGDRYVHAAGAWDAELQPTVAVDGAGRGIGVAERDWIADDVRGLTVVVHDAVTGDEVLCASF